MLVPTWCHIFFPVGDKPDTERRIRLLSLPQLLEGHDLYPRASTSSDGAIRGSFAGKKGNGPKQMFIDVSSTQTKIYLWGVNSSIIRQATQ